MIINDENFKRSILSGLADKEMVKILDAAMYRPKSINDIIRESGIPHTTAYRKIKSMLQEGLLVVEKIQISEDGKKFSLVRSALRSLNVKYQFNNIIIEAEKNIDALAKTAERFFSLDSE